MAAKAKPSGGLRIAIVLGVVLLVAAAAWGAWAWWTSRDTTPPEPSITPLAVDEPIDEPFEAEPIDEPPPPAAPSGEPAEEAEIRPWLNRYDELMSPLAGALDEIDFNGFEDTRCQALRAALGRASTLGTCPDAEIERALRPAFDVFSEAWNACRGAKEIDWSRQLLEGKQATHDAQVLMDRRYGYAGVLELELEGAIGVERSPESISGRYLLGNDSFGDFEDDGFEDDGFTAEDFDDEGYDDEPGFDEDYDGGESYDETG